MALRTFLAPDGTSWSVWRVESGKLGTGPRRAWLAFVDERAMERRRLFDIPPDWESLSPDALDRLRRRAVAVGARGPVALPEGVEFHAAPPRRGEPTSRVFRDPSGVEWHVWEVHPSLAEPRSTGDRRRTVEPRTLVSEHLRRGWLAFRSDTERRRYAPIPSYWMELSDRELSELLADAERSGDNDRAAG